MPDLKTFYKSWGGVRIQCRAESAFTIWVTFLAMIHILDLSISYHLIFNRYTFCRIAFPYRTIYNKKRNDTYKCYIFQVLFIAAVLIFSISLRFSSSALAPFHSFLQYQSQLYINFLLKDQNVQIPDVQDPVSSTTMRAHYACLY